MKFQLLLIILFVSAQCKSENEKKYSKSHSDTVAFKSLMRSTGTITLREDYIIDMDEWTSINPSFSKLDGNGHTITLDYTYISPSSRTLSLFKQIENKEIYNLKITTSYTKFKSGSLFGVVLNCYLYHVVLTLNSGGSFNIWKGDVGLISNAITSSTMLNVGVICSEGSIIMVNSLANNYDSNVGIIAGIVHGRCYFAGIYVYSAVEVESSYMNDNFGIFFGLVDTDSTVRITTSAVVSNKFGFYINSKHENYKVGGVIGANSGDVEFTKLVVSFFPWTNLYVQVSSSLSFGTLIGYCSGKVTISNSFIMYELNNIEAASSKTLYTGGLIGKSQSSTISLTNTSVNIIFANSKIPETVYGGFFIGYSSYDKSNLYNNIFNISFYSYFEYHDVGNENSCSTMSIQNTYYSVDYYLYEIKLRFTNFKSEKYPLSYLHDFSFDGLYHYSKMAYILSDKIVDSNDDFKKVDIKFNGKSPYFSSNNKNIYIDDNVPNAISSLKSSNYYIIIMPKRISDSYNAYFYEYNSCVSSKDLPLTVDTIYNRKVLFEFSCKSSIEFMVQIKTDSWLFYYNKLITWKSGGSGSDDNDYDPRDSLEILITKILIGVNAGVAGLIVLISICCYFTARN